MFAHIFVNRFKCLLRDRQMVFWTFLYPLVMATLFGLAFSNLMSNDLFTSIPVAVVNDGAYQSDKAFQAALESVSDANPAASQKLFHVTLTTREQAEEALKDDSAKGYIDLEGGAHVAVKQSGIGQSILKQFVDSYLQMSSAYQTILRDNPQAAQGFRFDVKDIGITELTPGKAKPNSTLTYFYALIAMAAMFGGLWGKKEISDIQADLTPQGARMNLSPVRKWKVFASSLSAAVAMECLSLLLLVAYMRVALGISFGNQLPFVLLTCLAGSIAGVMYGAFIGSLVKSETAKNALLISVSLFLSYLSGMMVQGIKYTVAHSAPVLAYINPANLIADAFYSLYYYSTYQRFFLNIGLLLGISLLFFAIVYARTRRQKYASL